MFLIYLFQLLILNIFDNIFLLINHEVSYKNRYYKYYSDIKFYHEFFYILLKFQYHCCYNVHSFILIHLKILRLFSFAYIAFPSFYFPNFSYKYKKETAGKKPSPQHLSSYSSVLCILLVRSPSHATLNTKIGAVQVPPLQNIRLCFYTLVI